MRRIIALLFAGVTSLATLSAYADAGASAPASPGASPMHIYVDAPENYNTGMGNVVVVGVFNLTGQPIRSLDFAGCRLWHIEPSGKWVAATSDRPEPAPQPLPPSDADLDPDLSTITLEIASAELVNTDRTASINISQGIGHVVIDPYRDHLYQVDVGRCMSQPGEYQLKAVLTKGGKLVYESPVRRLRIGAATTVVPAQGKP